MKRRSPDVDPEGDNGLSGIVDGALLAGALEAAFAGTHVPLGADARRPLFKGTLDEFAVANAGDVALLRHLKNNVKKCGACGKVCGNTMTSCNGCSSELPQETTHSHNIFMGFVYGVAKAPFPLTISVRKQTEELLVLDDLLQLSPCHLNVVPTTQYIPNWMFLLRHPRAGLALLQKLEDAAWACVLEQFVRHPPWRNKYLRPAGVEALATLDELRSHVVFGCNFPPSQFQLHLQCIMMPWTPANYQHYHDQLHLTPGRYFPLEYIKRVLTLDERVEVTLETPVERVLAHFDARVPYKEMHAASYARCGQSHRLLANWKPEDFAARVTGEAVVGSDKSKKDLLAADKATLQSYGRPYTAEGRPTGTFYRYARADRIPDWT
jgi:hypothetical protein